MAGKKPGKGMAIIIGMGKPMKAPKSAEAGPMEMKEHMGMGKGKGMSKPAPKKGGKKMPPMPKGKGSGQKGMNY
jgi:hypothetical protein